MVTAFWGSDAVINALDLGKTDFLMVIIFIASLLLLRKTKLGAVQVMLIAGVIKLAFALIGIG